MDLELLRTFWPGKPPSSPSPVHPATSTRPSSLTSSLPPSSDESLPSPSSSASRTLEAAVNALPPFTPYSAQVPWHTGFRAVFSHVFPKYGHYCGPNWSSGRNGGSLFWDKPPIDGLDYCCFCHDVGYDSHDQAKLYKADLEFLECLQKLPPPNSSHQHAHASPSGSHQHSNAAVAGLYRNLYMTGLQTFLIPYRRMLLGEMAAKKE